MCKIHCSGGCPECAPEEHTAVCVADYEELSYCSCNEPEDCWCGGFELGPDD